MWFFQFLTGVYEDRLCRTVLKIVINMVANATEFFCFGTRNYKLVAKLLLGPLTSIFDLIIFCNYMQCFMQAIMSKGWMNSQLTLLGSNSEACLQLKKVYHWLLVSKSWDIAIRAIAWNVHVVPRFPRHSRHSETAVGNHS